MKYIIKKLDKIGVQLFKQYGSDSYGIRCELHDLKEQLEALNIHTVSNSFYCQDEHYDNKKQCKKQCVTCLMKE